MSLLSISDNPRKQRDRHPGTGDDLRPARRARETPSGAERGAADRDKDNNTKKGIFNTR